VGAITKTLYDTDFAEWAGRNAQLLRAGRLDEVDLANVAEEIECLGKSERYAAESQLVRLLIHQIKRRIQPRKETASWRRSILDSRRRIQRRLEQSPSVKPFLEKDLHTTWRTAARDALLETQEKADLPDRCPFTLQQLLDDFELKWPD